MAASADTSFVQLVELDAAPNHCPLDAPLRLDWQYRTATAVSGCTWEVTYVLDIAHLARSLVLGRLPAADAAAGELRHAQFSCDKIDLAGLEPRCVKAIRRLLVTTLTRRLPVC